jgi:hypothetical protein
MAGVKKETTRVRTLDVVAGEIQEIVMDYNTAPNIIILNNKTGNSVYLSDTPDVSASSFDMQVVTLGTGKMTYAIGVRRLYVYAVNSGEVKITTCETDELYSADFHQTQETVISNSTTTSAVTIATGGMVDFGIPADATQTIPASNKSFMSYVKGIVSLFGSLIGLLPSSLTGSGNLKVAVEEALPSGSNTVGNVGINTGSNVIGNVGINGSVPAGTNSIGTVGINNYVTSASTYSAGTTTGSMLMLKNVADNTILPLICNSSGYIYTTEQNADVIVGKTVNVYNVTCTNANTEYSQALPSRWKNLFVSIQDGDSNDNYRIAWATGKVATPTAPFLKYNQDVEFSMNMVSGNSGTLYFASSVAGKVMQIFILT